MTDDRLGNLSAPSFRTWHVVARLLDGDGNDLAGEDRSLAEEITHRTRFPTQAWPDLFVIVSRRAGKTLFVGCVNAFTLAQDYRARMAPGELAVAAAVAPTTEQAGILAGYTRAMVMNSPLLCAQVVRDTATELEFAHGTAFKVYAGSMRSTRGPTYARASIDEASFLRSEESANPDVELVRAVRPGLITLNGSLVCFSSPYMRRGIMFDSHKKHFGNNDSKTLVIAGPSALFNPTLNAEAIARDYEDDPESAAAEWGGQFRSDLSAAFDSAWIDAAIDTGVTTRPPVQFLAEGRKPGYVSFTDPAGGSGKDSWSTRVVHAEGTEIIDDGLLELRPPFNTAEAAARVAAFLKNYGLSSTTGDKYAGRWPADALAKCGVAYFESALTKSDIYRESVALFSAGRVRLLDHPRTITQLRMLERRVRAGGRDQFDHPVGGSDDNSNALCGALHAARHTASPRKASAGVSDLFNPFDYAGINTGPLHSP